MLPIPAGALRGESMCGKPKTGEANVLVVEIGHVSLGKVLTINAEIDEDAGGASEPTRGIDNILWRALNHADKFRKRHGGNQCIVSGNVAV